MKYFTIYLGTHLVDSQFNNGYTFFDVVRFKLFNLNLFVISFKRKDDEFIFELIVLGISIYFAGHK